MNHAPNDADRANGNAKTKDGDVVVAAVLAFDYVNAKTHAYLDGATITTTGALRIHAGSTNDTAATADGTTVDSSTGVGIAVAVNLT